MQFYLTLLCESTDVPKWGGGFFKTTSCFVRWLTAWKFRCDPNTFFLIPVILHTTKCSFLNWSVMLRCYFYVVLEFYVRMFWFTSLHAATFLFFSATWCYPKKLLPLSPHTVLHQHLPKILQIINKFRTWSVCSKYREEGEWTSWVFFVLLIMPCLCHYQ